MTADEILARLEGRHPSVTGVAKFFAFAHLPEPLRTVSEFYCELMLNLLTLRLTTDGPELTVALRKLLEAKDAAVRAMLDAALD